MTHPGAPRRSSLRTACRPCGGFTLTELMMSVAVFTLVITGAVGTFAIGTRTWRATAAGMDASCQASTVLSRMAYGVVGNCGLRAAFAPVSTSGDSSGWTIVFTVPAGVSGLATQVNRLRYDSGTQQITFQGGSGGRWHILGKNVTASEISPSADSITVMVRTRAVVGFRSTVNEMTSTIGFRNDS